MPSYPQPIEKLISSFAKLPGIGRKAAERFVFYLLKQPKEEISEFSQNLHQLTQSQFTCPQCFNFSEQEGNCSICNSTTRDRTSLCVVEEVHDLTVIENTNEFKGLYHVLMGKIDPIEGMTADKLTINKLVERVKNNGVQEIILALNPDIQGEATIIHLKKLFQDMNVKVTLLARGLPMGSDIEYADEVTLSNALKGRQELK